MDLSFNSVEHERGEDVIHSELVGEVYHVELKELIDKRTDIIAIRGTVSAIVLNSDENQKEVNQFYLDCGLETVRVFFNRRARFYVAPGIEIVAVGRVHSQATFVAHSILLPQVRQVLGLGRNWEWLAIFPIFYIMSFIMNSIPFFRSFMYLPEIGFDMFELFAWLSIFGFCYALYWIRFRRPAPVTCYTKTWLEMEQIARDKSDFVHPDLRELFGPQSAGRSCSN